MAEEHKAPESVNKKSEEMVAVPPKGKSSGNKTLLIVIGVVVFLFVLLPITLFAVFAIWLGSGDNAEKLTEKTIESATGSNVDINASEGSFSVETQSGDQVSFGGEQDYADDFPVEVPKYPDGKVTSNLRTEQETSIYWANTVSTTDSQEKANTYFKEQMASWEETSTFTFDKTTSTTYKKDMLDVIISTTATTEGATITYNVTQQK